MSANIVINYKTVYHCDLAYYPLNRMFQILSLAVQIRNRHYSKTRYHVNSKATVTWWNDTFRRVARGQLRVVYEAFHSFALCEGGNKQDDCRLPLRIPACSCQMLTLANFFRISNSQDLNSCDKFPYAAASEVCYWNGKWRSINTPLVVNINRFVEISFIGVSTRTLIAHSLNTDTLWSCLWLCCLFWFYYDCVCLPVFEQRGRSNLEVRFHWY